MRNWVRDNIVGVVSVALAAWLALSGFVLWHSETLVRHDERIGNLQAADTKQIASLEEMQKDIQIIKEAVIKLSTKMECGK